MLGSKFDFLIIICNSKTVLNYCNWLILGKYKKLIGVNRNHRLAKFIKLKIRDLYGETIMMIPRGDSMVNDSIRDELESHPEITIENTTQFYDLVVFNRCATTDKLLLLTECWTNVHPDIVPIEVEWDYTIPYGIIYSKRPTPQVNNFINFVKDYLEKNKG
ncbi:MAG: hypothetical protein PUB15_03490 [Ruminobacter sp.]|nr:hypothetical protein [Ruminobacter sp.]